MRNAQVPTQVLSKKEIEIPEILSRPLITSLSRPSPSDGRHIVLLKRFSFADLEFSSPSVMSDLVESEAEESLDELLSSASEDEEENENENDGDLRDLINDEEEESAASDEEKSESEKSNDDEEGDDDDSERQHKRKRGNRGIKFVMF